MDCNTSLTHLPILPRLPRGLILLLIVSLILQLGLLAPSLPQPILPTLTLIPGRTHLRAARLRRGRHTVSVPRWGRLLANILPRLCVRSTLLAPLVWTSGWHALTPWTELVLLIPSLQTVLTLRGYAQLAPTAISPWNARLQRLYQLVVLLLLGSAALRLLGEGSRRSVGSLLPVTFGIAVTASDDETEIYIEPHTENQFHIVLQGAFHFFWEPQDSFEEVLLMLFLRLC